MVNFFQSRLERHMVHLFRSEKKRFHLGNREFKDITKTVTDVSEGLSKADSQVVSEEKLLHIIGDKIANAIKINIVDELGPHVLTMIAQNKKAKDSNMKEWLFAGPVGYFVGGMQDVQENVKYSNSH